MEYTTLNNGVTMPMVGLGTHGIPNDKLYDVMPLAFELGYRKFDTAWQYYNEEYIGDAIARNQIKREALFLTSKLHIDNLYIHRYHKTLSFLNIPVRSVRRAFEASCRRLKTDYLDLYLVHWPFMGYQKMWDEIVSLYEEGRIRAIGVSSFLPEHIDNLLKTTGVIPSVNQYEVNPFNAQFNETDYNKRKGICVEAYASFGTTVTNEKASVDMLGNETILSISENHKKTPSQIILRWTVQRGISVIPRSKSRMHLSENLDIFDFVLSDEEMAAIAALNRNQYSRGNPHNA